MKLHLVYAGYGTGEWTIRPPFDARNLLTAAPGLSGTEVQLFGQAKELARLGHDVAVFSRFVEEFELEGGVRCRDLDAPHEECDVAIAYHDGRPLDGWRAKRKVAYHQTYTISNRQQDASDTGADFAELYLAASERVARHHRARRGWDVRVVQNAWDLGELKPWRPIPGRLVFTTSVDRGARRLLEALPAIRERVPGAHVVMLGRGSPGLLGIRPSEGVEVLEQVSRNDVLALLSTASCYAYPCDVPTPTECFPVSLLEACAAGVPVVLAPDDGIEDIFAPGVWLTPGVKREPRAWREAFVNAVSEVLTNALTRQAYSRRAREFAAPFVFERTTAELCREVGI